MLAFQSGDATAAEAALSRLLQAPEQAAAARLAFVHAFRDETDEAFRWIGRATEHLMPPDAPLLRAHRFVEFSSSPFLRPLHGDPRWQAWMEATWQSLHIPGNERISEMLQRYIAETAGT
jgi:hypothetical protein